MKSINVTIRGLSPLLMHAFPLQPVEALDKKSPAEQAEIAAYRTPDGQLYVPSVAVQRGLVNAAAYSKGKGRSSLVKVTAACVLVSPPYLILDAQSYEIDARPVVVPATKGRIIRYRPRLDQWSLNFLVEYDETLLTEAQMRRIVDDFGQRVGLLDFRPEKRGPYGRSMVTQWNGEAR